MIGLLMASLFITAGMLTLFSLIKNPPPGFQPVFEKIPPARMAMSIVAVSYPFWAGVGGILGLLYQISAEQIPGGGIGSPNYVFTLAVVGLAIMSSIPFVVFLMRSRAVIGIVSIALLFMGVFGWLLPHFAA
jgi:hypothetical protein